MQLYHITPVSFSILAAALLLFVCDSLEAQIMNPMTHSNLKIECLRGSSLVSVPGVKSNTKQLQAGETWNSQSGFEIVSTTDDVNAVQMSNVGSLFYLGRNSFEPAKLLFSVGGTSNYTLEISGMGELFVNVDSPDLARSQTIALWLKTSFAIIETREARIYLKESYLPTVNNGVRSNRRHHVHIALLAGTALVFDSTQKQKVQLKPGYSMVAQEAGLGPPVPITRAEAAYDITCKLSKMARPLPARVPDQLRPVIKPVLGSITNSLGMILVPIPSTKIMMCAHETRCRDFIQFLKSTSGKEYDSLFRYPVWGWEDYPAFCNWTDAKGFCDWLSQKEGERYRLPTDEEWSYAVGLGSKEKRRPDTTPKDLSGKIKGEYPWGNQWPPSSTAGNYMDISHEAGSPDGQKGFHADLRYLVSKVDDGFKGSAPVMSFSPNTLGIYDLGGNASEWCEDWFDAERTSRVTRGQDYSGSQAIYDSGRTAMLSSWRDPGIYTAYGFRVVLESP